MALINSSVLLLKITLKCLLYHCGILENSLGMMWGWGYPLLTCLGRNFTVVPWLQGAGGGARQPKRCDQL